MARRYALKVLRNRSCSNIADVSGSCIQEPYMPSISLTLHWFKKGAPPGLEGSN